MTRKLTYTALIVFMISGSLAADDGFAVKKKSKPASSVKKQDNEKLQQEKMRQQLDSFVDSALRFIPGGGRPSVAVPLFDLVDDDRKQRNVNTALSNMLIKKLSSARYTLLCRDYVEDIQGDMDLDDNNLYGSKNEAPLGKAIKADYLVIGKLKAIEDGNTETISIRILDVRRNRIILEKTERLKRESLGIVMTNFLKEQDSDSFLPPSLRFFLGMEYFQHITTTHFKGTAGDMGFIFGINFDLNKRHSFQVLTSVLFSMADPFLHTRKIGTPWSPGDPDRTLLAESTINFKNSIDYQMGYGFIFRFFDQFYLRPSIFLGYSYMQYEYIHAGYHQSDVVGPDFENVYGGSAKTDSTTSYYVNLTADVLINYNSKYSYFVSFGYKFMFSLFMDDWSVPYDGQSMSGMYDAIISGLTMRAGVTTYL